MFNWTSSASSSPAPAPPRSVTPVGRGDSKPPTPPPETPSAALESALTAATHALAHARPATTEDDFELIEWSAAADPTTPAELQSTDARILALTNAVAQLTAVLQAESAAAASTPVSPASSAHSSTAPGSFPESPQVSCHGRTRLATSAAHAHAAANSDTPAPAQSQALEQTLRRLDSRLTRLESLVTHALASLRSLYPDGSPFSHPLTVRDLHAWGTQLQITSPNTTVAHVKQQLAARYAQWVTGCRLVWAGLVLQDEQFISAVVPAGGVVIIMGPAAGDAKGGRGEVGKGCHVQGAAARKTRDM